MKWGSRLTDKYNGMSRKVFDHGSPVKLIFVWTFGIPETNTNISRKSPVQKMWKKSGVHKFMGFRCTHSAADHFVGGLGIVVNGMVCRSGNRFLSSKRRDGCENIPWTWSIDLYTRDKISPTFLDYIMFHDGNSHCKQPLFHGWDPDCFSMPPAAHLCRTSDWCNNRDHVLAGYHDVVSTFDSKMVWIYDSG